MVYGIEEGGLAAEPMPRAHLRIRPFEVGKYRCFVRERLRYQLEGRYGVHVTSKSGRTLYVHVADDGGLLAIDGMSGRSAWVTERELTARLDKLSQDGGSLLLSEESGSSIATTAIGLVESYGLPIATTKEIHPDAGRANGLTALMSASYLGAAELAEDLVRRGATKEAEDDDGFTALMYAANGGQADMVTLLIAAGTEVDQADREGSTALMFAAQHGHLGIVKQLLAAGADPLVRRHVDGMTAHQFASGNGHQRVVAVLTSAEQSVP